MKCLELTFPGRYKTKIAIDGFELITDYPIEEGGDNEFAKPWDLFLASVASCHGIHVLTWCAENSIPYKDIKLTMDIIEDEEREGNYTDFIIEDNLPESFPRERISEMLQETTEDCWVNRHLTEYEVRVQYNIKHAGEEITKLVKGPKEKNKLGE